MLATECWFSAPGAHVTQRVGFAALVLLFISVCGFAQSLPDISSVRELPATAPPTPKYQRRGPVPIQQSNVLRNAASTSLRAGTLGVPFNSANVITVPNFEQSFISRGKTWHLSMIGGSPTNGVSTSIPVHIVAISLKLQNANLVSFTT